MGGVARSGESSRSPKPQAQAEGTDTRSHWRPFLNDRDMVHKQSGLRAAAPHSAQKDEINATSLGSTSLGTALAPSARLCSHSPEHRAPAYIHIFILWKKTLISCPPQDPCPAPNHFHVSSLPVTLLYGEKAVLTGWHGHLLRALLKCAGWPFLGIGPLWSLGIDSRVETTCQGFRANRCLLLGIPSLLSPGPPSSMPFHPRQAEGYSGY